MSWSRRKEWAVVAAILLAYLLLLGRTVSYEFVWDDVQEIERNEAFERPLLDGLFLTQTARTDPALTSLSTIELAYDSYRPMVFASLWLDIQVWGRSPAPLHAMNLLFGAFSILLVYALARRWFGGTLALAPVALFALHPIQIEAVAYISGRGDVLAGLFAFLALWTALRAIDARTRRRMVCWCALAALSFAASLLSKESAIGAPIVLAGILVVERRVRAGWWIPMMLTLVAIGYLLLRAALVTPTGGHALRDGLFALPGVALEYIRIVALPFDLSTERLRNPGYAVPGAVVALVSIGAGVYAARRHAATRNLQAAMTGVLWMCVLIAPAAVPIASTNVVADRYFYVPMLGLALAVTAAVSHGMARDPRLRRPLAIVGALWFAMWMVVAWRQVPVWRENRTLYSHAVAMSPESSMAHYRLGYLHAQSEQWDEAIPRLVVAVELDPDNVVALNNLGVGYLRTGQPASAIVPLAHAIEVSPAHFRAWLNLGLAQWSAGNREQGCASISRALAINPGYAPAARERARRCDAAR